MELKYFSNLKLEESLEHLLKTERNTTHLILLHILEFKARKPYAELGYPSMMSYLMKRFGYCESSAYRRIKAAKLIKTVPAVAEKLKDGSLNLSQVTKVQKNLTADENKPLAETKKILAKIEKQNGFNTDRILAREFDRPVQKAESLRPQKDESVQIQMSFTKEEFSQYETLKSLMSHICPQGKASQIFQHLIKKELKARLGNQKIEKPSSGQTEAGFNPSRGNTVENITQRLSSEKVSANETPVKKKRRHVSIKARREVSKNAHGVCQYRNSTGEIYGSRFQIQTDHKVPVAWGGSNDVSNLQILCRTHNLMMARQMRLG